MAGLARLGAGIELGPVDAKIGDAHGLAHGLLEFAHFFGQDASAFNFKGGDQQKKVGQLSGGERNRLHLAMTLREEGNVLLLDEPTNDLDVNTLRALEEGLENLARYIIRASFSQERMTYIAGDESAGGVAKVIYDSKFVGCQTQTAAASQRPAN